MKTQVNMNEVHIETKGNGRKLGNMPYRLRTIQKQLPETAWLPCTVNVLGMILEKKVPPKTTGV